MMRWEAEQKGYTCNNCYLSMQNCHDMSICCEDETGLCDYFEEMQEDDEAMKDLIERQTAIDAVERNACNTQRIYDAIKDIPAAQPERYTKEELKIFLHGLSLRLLSLRSAQHWGYDDKRAKEIKFLAHLYEKVEADMKGEA